MNCIFCKQELQEHSFYSNKKYISGFMHKTYSRCIIYRIMFNIQTIEMSFELLYDKFLVDGRVVVLSNYSHNKDNYYDNDTLYHNIYTNSIEESLVKISNIDLLD